MSTSALTSMIAGFKTGFSSSKQDTPTILKVKRAVHVFLIIAAFGSTVIGGSFAQSMGATIGIAFGGAILTSFFSYAAYFYHQKLLQQRSH